MKYLLTATAFIICTFATLGQDKKEIAIRFTYKGSPLCNWEVTLKHGDVQLARTTSDQNGYARFPEATVLSKSVDAFGYKAHKNGDKKWDVKGYITLDDNFEAAFDFQDIMKEMSGSGMPVSMLEASWGLTLNDCGQVVSSGSGSEGATHTNQHTEKEEPSESANGAIDLTDANASIELAKQRKQGFENEIVMIDRKILKLEKEIEDAQSDSKDTRLLEAELNELRAKKAHRQAAIQIADAEIAGSRPDAEVINNERTKKDQLEEAKDQRKAIEKELKNEGKSPKGKEANGNDSSTGSSDEKKMSPAMAKIKLQKLKAELKMKQNSLKKDEESGKYSEDYLDNKRAEIKAIESEISQIEESLKE